MHIYCLCIALPLASKVRNTCAPRQCQYWANNYNSSWESRSLLSWVVHIPVSLSWLPQVEEKIEKESKGLLTKMNTWEKKKLEAHKSTAPHNSKDKKVDHLFLFLLLLSCRRRVHYIWETQTGSVPFCFLLFPPALLGLACQLTPNHLAQLLRQQIYLNECWLIFNFENTWDCHRHCARHTKTWPKLSDNQFFFVFSACALNIYIFLVF